MVQPVKNPTSIHKDLVGFLASFSGLSIQHSLQMGLGFCIIVAVAVAMAGSCSSDLAPSLGTSTCFTCGPKKTGGQKKRSRNSKGFFKILNQNL